MPNEYSSNPHCFTSRVRKGSRFALSLEPFSLEYRRTGLFYPSHDSLTMLFVIFPHTLVGTSLVAELVRSHTIFHVVLPIPNIRASILVRHCTLTISFRRLPSTIVLCLIWPSVLALSCLVVILPVAFVGYFAIFCIPSHYTVPMSTILVP